MNFFDEFFGRFGGRFSGEFADHWLPKNISRWILMHRFRIKSLCYFLFPPLQSSGWPFWSFQYTFQSCEWPFWSFRYIFQSSEWPFWLFQYTSQSSGYIFGYSNTLHGKRRSQATGESAGTWKICQKRFSGVTELWGYIWFVRIKPQKSVRLKIL